MAIGVDGEGDAMAVGECVEKLKIPVGVLVVAEFGGEHRSGGIVHSGEEGEPGAAGLQPRMGTAIEEDEHARLGHAPSSAAVQWRPAAACTVAAGLVQHSPGGGAGPARALAPG